MAELDRAAISLRMKESRDAAGLIQVEIAELLSPPIHWRTVQDWESPKMNVVPFDRLDEWARMTQTTREWLLHGQDAAVSSSAGPDLERFEAAVARLEAVADRLDPLAIRCRNGA